MQHVPVFPAKVYTRSLYICVVRLLNNPRDCHWAFLRADSTGEVNLHHWAAPVSSGEAGQHRYVKEPVHDIEPEFFRSIRGLGDILALVKLVDCQRLDDIRLDKACQRVVANHNRELNSPKNGVDSGPNGRDNCSRSFIGLVLKQLLGQSRTRELDCSIALESDVCSSRYSDCLADGKIYIPPRYMIECDPLTSDFDPQVSKKTSLRSGHSLPVLFLSTDHPKLLKSGA